MDERKMIYLDDAIDAICKHGTALERRGILVLALVEHKQMTIDLLESLPSAQGYADTAYIERLSDLAFDSGFALGKASAQRWIPVSERLPKENGRYLTANGQGWYEVASYAHQYSDVDAMYELPQDGGGWYIYDSEWGYCVYSSVVAWMPLPEPWKGENDG